MSPEQLVGETVDERTDIHALGIITLEMLTGLMDLRGPFFARADTMLAERLGDGEASATNQMLCGVLRRSFHPAREDRYASVEEFRTDIMAALSASSASASHLRRA